MVYEAMHEVSDLIEIEAAAAAMIPLSAPPREKEHGKADLM